MRYSGNFLAMSLSFNQAFQTILIGVVILLGMERRGEALDQLLSQRALLLLDFGLIRVAMFLGRANLVGIKHGVEGKAALARADDDDILAIVHGDFRDSSVTGFFHGLGQEVISLLAGIFGSDIVRRVEIDGIDFFELDEFENVHGARRIGLYFVQFLLGKEEVL